MSRQQDIDLAKHAKNALDNPALQEAFKRYENKIVEQIRTADYRDRDLLDAMKRHLTSLGVVRRNLEIMVADGVEARTKIDFERQTLGERAKAAFRRIA